MIGPNSEQLGVISRDQALAAAREAGLDLVEIAATSRPPVCRIMDYGKFKYEQSKKQSAAKKSQSTVELKEIKFRPKTDDHDLEFKTRHIRRFLEEGNKVRLVIVFRGREVVHPRTGVDVLNRVVEACEDIGNVESRPNMEGKRMFMIIGPKAGLAQKMKNNAKKNKKPPAKKKSANPAAAKASDAAKNKEPEKAPASQEAKPAASEGETSSAPSES